MERGVEGGHRRRRYTEEKEGESRGEKRKREKVELEVKRRIECMAWKQEEGKKERG